MPSSNARRGRRLMCAESLESRTLFDTTPVFLHELVSTGPLARFHGSTINGIPFIVEIKKGTADIYDMDNRLELTTSGTGAKSSVIVLGRVELADVAVGGSLKLFQANNCDVSGVMAISGSVNKFSLGGVSGTLAIAGSVNMMTLGGVKGTVAVGGTITKLTTGALNGATILNGAILPADNPLGNNNTTYSAGSIGTMLINGPVYNSSIAVGVSPGPDGVFGNSDDANAGGGTIGKLTLNGGADTASHVEAGGFGIVKIRPLQSDAPLVTLANPLSDPIFSIPGSA